VPCERQGQLLKLFRASVSSYSIAVNDLNLTRGKTSKQEYGRLLARWERARKPDHEARGELRGNTLFEIGYIGNVSHRLEALRAVNESL
jgi:hypothetical protein